MDSLLNSLDLPGDLKKLSLHQLKQLGQEIRSFIIKTVSDNGGHLAPNLGVVELTLALHSTFNSPRDQIIWDVGHQTYAHKLVTGRRDRFISLRRHGGLSGFPKPSESRHDPFGTGHSSTSVSAALGLAKARDLRGENYQVVAVIGDGALTGGMAFEALNNAGHLKTDLLVVLNDNEMSINTNVGSLPAYLGRLRTDPKYSKLKRELESFFKQIPVLGRKMVESAERLKGSLKYLLVPGMLFEELGFTYLGPVDGHNLLAMKDVFRRAGRMKGPVLVHVLTEKGKGYTYAEQSPVRFHGIGPFNMNNGQVISSREAPTYTEVFSNTMVRLAEQNQKIMAITAAMTTGTGLDRFASAFPHRFFDVGIAEQHGITFAAALAAGGFQPVVAVYSTFLQRGFDQLIHDVCLQNLPVVLAIDRAGIVGEDGETHQGQFDLSYLRLIPNLAIMAPMDELELQNMLYTALLQPRGPVAIRYPKGQGEGVKLSEPAELPWAKGQLLQEGKDLLIVAAGTTANSALRTARKLSEDGIKAAVINPRFIKPLHEELILDWANRCKSVLTVEENVLDGGFGSSVMELLINHGCHIPVRRLGIDDRFVEQGPRSKMLSLYRLDAPGIYQEALNILDRTKKIKDSKVS
ncbi:MAG TPA: 1-deoxy-D-xylulose-5-phosphate synthase [Firmicutes bacterium]|nr:1-deoxy-D-xylulose-5-phosphate synthase [Bacillota bacterium]